MLNVLEIFEVDRKAVKKTEKAAVQGLNQQPCSQRQFMKERRALCYLCNEDTEMDWICASFTAIMCRRL